MKLSVALCTYNGEKYLQEQLNSIASQTMLPDELVVCDDGSKDSTLSLLNDFRQQVNFPVHIYQNDSNLGSTKNFEKAITLCQGELITLCDQDDLWRTNKLQRSVEVLDAHPDAGYVFSDADLIGEESQLLNITLWDTVSFTGSFRERFLKGEQVECFIQKHIVTGATMTFRKEIGHIAMPFPESETWIHDGWIALISSAIGAKGIAIAEPLICYRQHSCQQVGLPAHNNGNDAQKNGSDGSGATKTLDNKHLSLFARYKDMKEKKSIFIKSWEQHFSTRLEEFSELKEKLVELEHQQCPLGDLEYLKHIRNLEAHFINRRAILTSAKGIHRYNLILKEVISGRYALFANSWRTIIRDCIF